MSPMALLLATFGLTVNMAGSAVLIVPQVNRKKAISKLSGTYADSNPYLAKALGEQTFLAIAGMVLLVIGFFLQLLSLITS